MTRAVSVDGAELFVATDGDPRSPALFLFSGARCNTGMWEPVLPALTDRFFVARHDVRGAGRSQVRAGADCGLDRLADDAAAVADELGIASCAAWGMAFGARVALAFASRHPGRVERLALFDASVEAPDVKAQRASASLASEERRRRGLPDPRVERSWFGHEDPEAADATLRAVYAPDDHARYAEGISIPTLIATGDLDPNLPASRRLHQMIPGSRLVVLEAVGHGSVLQRPDLCMSVACRILA